MSQVYQVTGELTDDRTVKLDKALPVTGGRVRVTVEFEPNQPRPDLRQFLERIWEGQRLRGHVPPTKGEIDAYLKAERDSWDF